MLGWPWGFHIVTCGGALPLSHSVLSCLSLAVWLLCKKNKICKGAVHIFAFFFFVIACLVCFVQEKRFLDCICFESSGLVANIILVAVLTDC